MYQATYPELAKACLVLLAVVGLIFMATDAEARIYKTKDKDGNIVFTDVPPKDQAEAVELTPANQYTAPVEPQQPTQRTRRNDDVEEEVEETTSYNRIAVVSPEADQAIRENAGNVSIIVEVTPGLDVGAGHTVEVLLGDRIAGSANSGLVALENVDRGTHMVRARVVDANGNIMIQSEPVAFHMLRYSALRRAN